MTSITLDDLLNDLQKAKAIAERNENPNALVTATLAQAKLLGLDKPKPKENDAVRMLRELMEEIEQDSRNEETTYHS